MNHKPMWATAAISLAIASCHPMPGVAVPLGGPGSELYRWQANGQPRVGTGADYCADMELSLRMASARKSYVGWGFTTLSALSLGTSTVLAVDEDPSKTKRHIMAGAPLVGAALAGIAAAYFLRSIDTGQHAAEAARAATDPNTAADQCLGVLADWNETRRRSLPSESESDPNTPETAASDPEESLAYGARAAPECQVGDRIGIFQVVDAHTETAALLVDGSGQLVPSEYLIAGSEQATLKQAAPELSNDLQPHRIAQLRLNGHGECLFAKPAKLAGQCRVSLAGLLHLAGAKGSRPGLVVPDEHRLDCPAGASVTVPELAHRSLTEAPSVARWNEWTRQVATP